MRFFLGNEEVKIAVAPEITFTQDETPDTFYCELEINDNPNAYAPLQEFTIEWDDLSLTKLILLSDQVSLVSFKPLKYKHTLSLIQNIHFLTKHLLRDTIFTQPSHQERKAFFNFTVCSTIDLSAYERFLYNINPNTRSNIEWNTGIRFSQNEKISSFKYKINIYKTRTLGSGVYELEKVDDVQSIFSNLSFVFAFREEGQIERTRVVNIDLNTFEVGKYYELEDINTGNGIDEILVRNPSASGIAFKQPTEQGLIVFNLEYCADVYHYNCYDILDICLKQYQKKRNNLQNEPPLFNLPDVNSELGQLLVNTIPPNMVFKQNTIYDVISQVFSLFDSIFTLDSNNVLGVEYFNDRKDIINKANFSAKNKTYKEDNYNNRVVNHYQNAVMDYEHPLVEFAMATSENVGVPTAEDHIVKVPEPIDYIREMFVKFLGNISVVGNTHSSEGRSFSVNMENYALDISYFIMPETQWGLLDTGESYPIKTPIEFEGETYQLYSFSRLVKNCTMKYSKGATSISLTQKVRPQLEDLLIMRRTMEGALRQFFGWDICSEISSFFYDPNEFSSIPALQDTTGLYNTVYTRVKYITNTNGVIAIETNSNKYNGEYLSSQAGSNVDLYKLGVNLVGILLRSGNEIMNVTQEIKSFDEAIKKGDYFLDESGQYWVANICKYTIYNNKVIANIEFSKNYNSLNLNTRIDKEIRLSNIESAFADKCTEIINEYAYLSLTEKSNPYNDSCIHRDFVAGSIARNLGGEYNKVISYVAFKKKTDLKPIYIPTKIYSAGFNMCLESSFNDPISAGIKNTTENRSTYSMQPVLYAGEDGFSDSCDIYYVYDEKISEFGYTFPYIPREKVYEEDTQVGGITDFYYYKKPNEIFGVNYQLVFLSEDIFIGKEFMRNNFFTTRNDKKLYLYISITGAYSILDTKVLNNSTRLDITDVEIGEGTVTITADYSGLPIYPFHVWAIGDEKGNLYLSSNVKKARGSSIVLYLTTSPKRL